MTWQKSQAVRRAEQRSAGVETGRVRPARRLRPSALTGTAGSGCASAADSALFTSEQHCPATVVCLCGGWAFGLTQRRQSGSCATAVRKRLRRRVGYTRLDAPIFRHGRVAGGTALRRAREPRPRFSFSLGEKVADGGGRMRGRLFLLRASRDSNLELV